MSTITFLSTDIETKKMSFGLEEKMKDVCKKYAKVINEDIKKLVFYSNGKKLVKKMSVLELNKTNPKNELYVVLMDEKIDSESEEEKANSMQLKKEILDCITNPEKEITYEKTQELIVQYGLDSKKRIEKEKKEHPENFIEINDAINNKEKDEKLYVLGQLGKSLENMGIEVAIDKREGKNNEDSLILNQTISSGILQDNKYEIHIEEDDINKKYAVINNENGEQVKFIEEMKELLSKNIGIPKNDIFISNVREGSEAFDAIIKKKNNVNIREKMKELSKLKNIKSIYEKNILEACKLTPNMLDERGNRNPSEWPEPPQTRGGLPYHPPTHDWVGYGLKVWNQYDNKNNDWIAMDNNPNEWAVAFHGTSTSAVKPICKKDGKFFSTVDEGAKWQKCKDYINVNKKSQNLYKTCGEGAYVSPHLEYAAKYYKGAMIMCRVNPNKIRIPQGEYEKYEYLTDGTRNTIRPYRLLVPLKKDN